MRGENKKKRTIKTTKKIVHLRIASVGYTATDMKRSIPQEANPAKQK